MEIDRLFRDVAEIASFDANPRVVLHLDALDVHGMTGARIGDVGQVPPRSLELAVNDADIGEPRSQRQQPERTQRIGNAIGFSEIAGRDSARADRVRVEFESVVRDLVRTVQIRRITRDDVWRL